MMHKITFLLAIVILSSCSPQKRLARLLERFPPDTTIQIAYRDTTIYRDTVIYREIPGDTVWRDSIIPVEVDLPDMALKTRSTLAEATAWIRDNRLGVELVQYDSVFRFKLDSAIRENSDTTIIVKEIPYPVPQKAKPFYKNGFFVLMGLVVLTLVLFFTFRRR